MRLYLIRHGQSVNNALSDEDRWEQDRVEDPPLTEIGHQQAELAGQYLQNLLDAPGRAGEPVGITHLYCSAMKRALQTAQPIARDLGVTPEVWVDIHEIGGIFLASEDGKVTGFPGMTRAEIAAEFPDTRIVEGVTDTGWWDVNIGRETPAHFVSRAVRVALALRERARSDERIALVSHGAFLDALIKALLNQAPGSPDGMFYSHYNTAMTRIDFNEGRSAIGIHYMNRVQHLPYELLTW